MTNTENATLRNLEVRGGQRGPATRLIETLAASNPDLRFQSMIYPESVFEAAVHLGLSMAAHAPEWARQLYLMHNAEMQSGMPDGVNLTDLDQKSIEHVTRQFPLTVIDGGEG